MRKYRTLRWYDFIGLLFLAPLMLGELAIDRYFDNFMLNETTENRCPYCGWSK